MACLHVLLEEAASRIVYSSTLAQRTTLSTVSLCLVGSLIVGEQLRKIVSREHLTALNLCILVVVGQDRPTKSRQ